MFQSLLILCFKEPTHLVVANSNHIRQSSRKGLQPLYEAVPDLRVAVGIGQVPYMQHQLCWVPRCLSLLTQAQQGAGGSVWGSRHLVVGECAALLAGVLLWDWVGSARKV